MPRSSGPGYAPILHAPAVVALARRQRVIAPDVEKFPSLAGTPDLASYLETGIRAVQSTPLLSRRGELVGMISTHWKDVHEPSERDLRLLDILARLAADLIERKTQDEELRRREERLRTLTQLLTDVPWQARADGAFAQLQPAWENYTGRRGTRMRGTAGSTQSMPTIAATFRRPGPQPVFQHNPTNIAPGSGTRAAASIGRS